MRKKESHLAYYTSLCGMFLIGFLFLLHFSPDRIMQFLTVVVMGFLYVFLGIIHHFQNHDLVPKIVVEYVLIATLGVTLVYFVLRGGFGI